MAYKDSGWAQPVSSSMTNVTISGGAERRTISEVANSIEGRLDTAYAALGVLLERLVADGNVTPGAKTEPGHPAPLYLKLETCDMQAASIVSRIESILQRL